MPGGQHDAGGADEVVRSAEGDDTSSAGPPVQCLDEPPESLIVQVARSADALCDLQAAGEAVRRENAALKEKFNHCDQAVQLIYQACKASPDFKVQAAALKDDMAETSAMAAEISAGMNRIKAGEARVVMQIAENKATMASQDAVVLSECQELEAWFGSLEREHSAADYAAAAAAAGAPAAVAAAAAAMKEAAEHCERAAERNAELSHGQAQKDLCRSIAATFRRKVATMEAAEVEAKAVWMAEVEAKAVRMAEAEAKANAAADALLAEEAVEKAAAAASASKARRGKGKRKSKGKGKNSANAAAQAAANQAQANAAAQAAANRRLWQKAVTNRRLWQKAIRRVIAQARADAKATADNAAAAAKQRAVRERAGAAASAKAEPGYTPAGPSHKGPAVAWGEEAPDARDKAKRLTAKEASLEAAKKAEAEKRAEKDRKTAERLEQFRNVRIGESITSGK